MIRFSLMVRRSRIHALVLLVLTVACDSPERVRIAEGRLADASYGRFAPGAKPSAADAALATQLLDDPARAVDDAARGRALLILKRSLAAVSALSIAAAESTDPSVANDLAVAYLAVAPTDGGLKVNMMALDSAARALRLARADPPAPLFNVGVAASRVGLGPAALQAFDRFEAVEKDARWRAEVRSRREELARAAVSARAVSAGDLQSAREAFFAKTLQEFGRALLGNSADGETEIRRVAEQANGLTGGHDTFATDCVSALRNALEGRPEPRRQIANALVAQGDGLQFYSSAEYERADAAFAAAAPVLERVQPCGLISLVNLGMTRRQARDYRVGRQLADRVIESAHARAYASVEARALWLRGLVQQDQSDVEAAIADYRRAIDLYDAGHEADNAASVTRVCSDAFRNAGNLESGWLLLEPRLRRVYSLATPLRRHLFLLNAALYASDDGMPDAAIVLQSAAVEEAKTRGVAGSLVGAYLGRAAFYQQVGDAAHAVADLDEAEKWMPGAAKDSASSAAFYRARMRIVRASLLTEAPSVGRQLLSDDLIQYFLRLAPEEAPRVFLQRGRLAELQGRDAIATQDFTNGLAEFERQWLKLSDRERRGTFMNASWELFGHAISMSLLSDPPGSAAFALAESSRARGLGGALSSGHELRDVQRAVAPGDVVLYFSSLSNELLCWRITRDTATLRRVALSRRSLADAVDRFTARIQAARDVSDIASDAQGLFSTVIGDALRDQGDGRVFVSADGPLHRLPFAALRNPATGRFVIEDHPLEMLARAADLFGVDAAKPSTGDTALIVGGNTAIGGEISVISAKYRASQPLTGAAATPQAMLARLSQSTVVHVASHAEANPAFPWSSHLLLSPDAVHPRGWLTAAEIADSAATRLRLVVLAACETAAGSSMKGEGLIGLVRAFLRPGVSVVGSLWKVDDASTARLMPFLHDSYLQEGSAAVALRHAQLALLHSSDPTDRLPQNWAAFEVFGRRAQADR